MNRRILRLALLVVLLVVSFAGVYGLGNTEPSRLVLAQDECALIAATGTPNAAATPSDNEIPANTDENQIPLIETYSVSMSLHQGDQATFASSSTVAVWITRGTVRLTLCGPGQAVVQLPGTSELTAISSDSVEIPEGGSIFIAPGTEYVLTSVSQQAALTAVGTQPMRTRSLCIGGGC